MSQNPLPPVTDRALRAALGQFATGVTIVTTRAPDGSPVGLTVSSFNSVSLAPPLVLWSLALGASTLQAFRDCEYYAIHVLEGRQLDWAMQFASRSPDRFANIPHQPGLGGVPLLPHVLATFECRNQQQLPGGDHLIFLGEVVRCSHRADGVPLLYHAGELFASDHRAPVDAP